MPDHKLKEIYEVTWLIRRAFRLMGARVDQYLKDLDISACDRSVMEFLYPDKKLSVPQISELYDVSRQHIQSTVNVLHDRNIIKLHDNPKHKRSPLVGLSANGCKLYAEIQRRDILAFTKIFNEIKKSDNKVTRKTLKKLVNSLVTEIENHHQKENKHAKKLC